jgi:hypothetical protein
VEVVRRCLRGAFLAPRAVRLCTTGCSRYGMRSLAAPAGPKGEAFESDGVTTPVNGTAQFKSRLSPGIVVRPSGIRASTRIRGPAPPGSSP